MIIRLDTGREAAREAAALLSDAERQRARQFAFASDRNRFAAARAHLRRLLATRLDIDPRAVEFAYGRRGKPALARRYAAADLRFNLSHCGDVAAFAFAEGREIGIDIEAVLALPDADDVAARFFSPRERKAYLALCPRDRPLGFFNCWTRKEAFIKALGEGLCHPLHRFDVSLAPGEPARILRVGNTRGRDVGWTLHDFRAGPGLVGAVVAQKSAAGQAPDAEPIVTRLLPRG